MDEKSYELAEHFMPDGNAIDLESLAQTIQDAVDDWFYGRDATD